MKKSLHIVVGNLDAPKRFAEALKMRIRPGDAEGVVLITSATEIEIDVCGPKEQVDDFLGVLDTVVFFEQKNAGHTLSVVATPLIRHEDYRGVLRFVMPH